MLDMAVLIATNGPWKSRPPNCGGSARLVNHRQPWIFHPFTGSGCGAARCGERTAAGWPASMRRRGRLAAAGSGPFANWNTGPRGLSRLALLADKDLELIGQSQAVGPSGQGRFQDRAGFVAALPGFKRHARDIRRQFRGLLANARPWA